jgi:hypothetical protein
MSYRQHYWAVRPKAIPTHIRIEKAPTPRRAVELAFGSPISFETWEAKDMGTQVRVIQSDNKRIALLRDPENWFTVT